MIDDGAQGRFQEYLQVETIRMTTSIPQTARIISTPRMTVVLMIHLGSHRLGTPSMMQTSAVLTLIAAAAKAGAALSRSFMIADHKGSKCPESADWNTSFDMEWRKYWESTDCVAAAPSV